MEQQDDLNAAMISEKLASLTLGMPEKGSLWTPVVLEGDENVLNLKQLSD